MRTKRCIIGIDEVGRGALAGPVVVAAAMLACSPREFARASVRAELGLLKDSKQLTPAQREAWYAHFAAHPAVAFAIARVYPRQIEQRNISAAANLAALRAYRKLMVPKISQKVFLDGGVYLGSRAHQEKHFASIAATFPKADETIPAVAIASIIAKVHRDRYMTRLAKQYPDYGFEAHKGYGTKRHQEALLTIGASVVHRTTFVKVATF